jgi:hypothetical protein
MTKNVRSMIRAFLWFLLVSGFIVYLTYYDSLKGIFVIIRNLGPIIILIMGTVLIVDKYHDQIERRKMKGEVEEVIYITYMDAMKNDLLAFFTAALILLTALFLSGDGLNTIDIIQAIIAFCAIYYIRFQYFSKIGR